MSTIFQRLSLLGALGMFLYGMTLMSEGLQKVAGSRLRSILSAMTANSFTRVLTGTLITAVIQSSSATTVMIVSFVNAGLLSLTQAVGVIMGANIGTTVTSWLISLLGFTADISVLSIPLVGVGFVFMMFKSQKRKSIGEMIIGFALLFLGLTFLKDSVPDLSANPEAIAFIQKWTGWGFPSVLVFVLVGTVLTIILQSSSATVALTLVMASQGWIPFEIAAAMVLGENIGTTITANIAASVGNISAKRAALAHTVFNVFGVIWVLAVYKPFLWLVSKIVIGLGGSDPFTSPDSLLYAISTVHTLFNITNTCILIWFTPQIVKFVTWIIKGHKDEEEVFRLRYIQGGMMSTAELSLEQAEQEVVHFSEIVKRQYAYARQAVNEADNENRFDELFKKLEHYEQITDRIEFEIAKYLSNIGEGELSQEGTNRMHALYKIISELESMGDSGFNIGRILQRKNLHGQKFDESTVKKLNHMLDLVDTAIDSMIVNLRQGFHHIINISNAQDAEHDINEYRDNLKEEHLRHIEAEESEYLRGVYYMDLVSECERVGDFAINISEALVEVN